MKLNNKIQRKGFTLVELLVVISIIVALGALATPALLKQQKKADMLQGVNNARQSYLLLAEFDQDFGAYPTETIMAANAEEFEDAPTGTGNSNRYLGALVAAGYVESEEIFFCKGDGVLKPDNVINSASEVLKSGECGFAYVDNQSSSKNGGRTLLAGPMTESGEEFQRDPFSGKAVILRIDGSVKTERISKAGGDKTKGEVKIGGGLGLFETGEDSVWGAGGEDNSFTTADILKPDLNN